IQDVAADLDDLLDPNTTLKPYATVNGTVFGEDEKPAAGITVTLSRADSKGEYKVTTKKDGTYTYDGLPAGQYVTGVIYKGDAGLLRDVTLRTGRVVTSDFDLKTFVSMGKPGTFDELRKRGEQQAAEEKPASNNLDNLEMYDKARS